MIYWLTGISGSGKSTLAKFVQSRTGGAILDADDIRAGLNKDLGFTRDGVRENVRRIAHIAKLFNSYFDIVQVCCISPYLSDRDMAREIIDFREVYVKTDINTIYERKAGIHKKGYKNVAGADFEYEENPNAYVYENSGPITFEKIKEVYF